MNLIFISYIRNIIVILLGFCLLSGFKPIPVFSKAPQEYLYKQGIELITAKKYKKAAKHFFEMYTEEPASKFAAGAMLLESYCLYKDKSYLDAIHTLDDLEKFHPRNYRRDYAFYLRMLSYKDQIHKVEGCYAVAFEALTWCNAILIMFPESPYAQDVLENHLPLVQDYLVEKEMLAGRYHLNCGNPVGALLSFQNAITGSRDEYFLPEALFRISESYIIMGLKEEAFQCKTELVSKFPDSVWAKKASKF